MYRRYKEFEDLAKEMGGTWKAKMPPKTFFKSRSMEFMTERQAALSLWLHELMSDESLNTLLPVRKFLGEGANQMPRGAKPVTSKSAQGQDPYKEDKTVGCVRMRARRVGLLARCRLPPARNSIQQC